MAQPDLIYYQYDMGEETLTVTSSTIHHMIDEITAEIWHTTLMLPRWSMVIGS